MGNLPNNLLSGATVNCQVLLQELLGSGETKTSTTYKNCRLELGRNEFRDILLRVHTGDRLFVYSAKNVVLYKRFLSEGKATVHFSELKVRLLLSNCPPNCLYAFLKTMVGKNATQKLSKSVSAQQRLLSNKSRTFDEISPLSAKDLTALKQQRSLTTPQKHADINRSGSGPQKRVYDENADVQPAAKKTSMARQIRSHLLEMTKEQQRVLEAVLLGESIFFTGSAGTGKSFVLEKIIGSLPPEQTFTTASTGVAACHISGMTLHSFAGIGSGSGSLDQCVRLASRPTVATQWRRCKHLIIDEISMVDGQLFTKLEAIARVIRKCNQPFGGIQLIVCGDFLQLPPVTKQQGDVQFCFQTSAWRKSISRTILLNQVKRQEDDNFIQILQAIRFGKLNSDMIDTLQSTAQNEINRDGIVATRLCTHNTDVEVINNNHLDQATGAIHTFEAVDSDPDLSDHIDKLCTVSKLLTLKVGAQVMLMKNSNVQKGLVNGARGVVVGFEKKEKGLPVVKFHSGLEVTMKPEKWIFKRPGGFNLIRTQVPLRLAWAISIHKSQGMTLDLVEISLGRVFEYGQAYVALSRAKSLKGLKLIDFSPTCVKANPVVVKFYKELWMRHR